MVQVAISRCGQFQSPEADIVEGLVVDAVCFVGIFNQLMDRQRSVVGFNDGI